MAGTEQAGGCPYSDWRHLRAVGKGGSPLGTLLTPGELPVPWPHVIPALCVSQAIVLGTKLQLQADLDVEKVRVFLM